MRERKGRECLLAKSAITIFVFWFITAFLNFSSKNETKANIKNFKIIFLSWNLACSILKGQREEKKKNFFNSAQNAEVSAYGFLAKPKILKVVYSCSHGSGLHFITGVFLISWSLRENFSGSKIEILRYGKKELRTDKFFFTNLCPYIYAIYFYHKNLWN